MDQFQTGRNLEISSIRGPMVKLILPNLIQMKITIDDTLQTPFPVK